MERIRATILLLATGAAAFAITVILYHPGRAEPAANSRGAAPADRWAALTQAERSAYIERYQAIASRPNAGEVFRRARRFAALPAAQQADWRGLYAVLADALGRLSAPQRLALLLLDEHARAEAVYQLLEAESPETLREWHSRLDRNS